MQGHNCRVPSSLLKTAEILLAQSGALGELFLRQAFSRIRAALEGRVPTRPVLAKNWRTVSAVKWLDQADRVALGIAEHREGVAVDRGRRHQFGGSGGKRRLEYWLQGVDQQ